VNASPEGSTVRREGGCLCRAVRFSVVGDPLRIGVCHCRDCRKTSGSGFATFAIWPRRALDATGQVATFEGRSFCAICGSRLFSLRPDEAEIMVGALDSAPTDLVPTYEVWVRRREQWLQQMPWADQFEEDRTDAEGDWRQPIRAG
jgi:hypothetical protein